jgi:hypothetical protein
MVLHKHMQQIQENDYYAIFQTGLFIAVKEHGAKQAQLADLCKVNPSYLSKLKGWDIHKTTKDLVAKPHVTKTNFKNYAVPILRFLEKEHQIVFEDGYFKATQDPGETKQWGNIDVLALPDPSDLYEPFPPKTPPLENVLVFEDLEIPETGELEITWDLDLSNVRAIPDLIEKIKRIADKANAQLAVKIVLRKCQTQVNYKSRKYTPAHETMAVDIKNQINVVPHNPNFKLEVNEYSNNNRFTELVSTKDAISGIQQEQFCDYTDWETLRRSGDQWRYQAASRVIRGSGMYELLLSRYPYGAKPFSLEAILGFDHYAQYTGDGSETANAGIVLGWRISEGREQYYNLLLNGQRMLLELVGARTGNQYADYEHLDEGVPFVVEDGRAYHFKLHVTPEFITVKVDDELRYQIATPPDIEGRAGIRPWRAALYCQYFELLELPALPQNAL